ncbi:MAG: type IV secretion system protein TraC [Candidatus Obscuribacterales bacterium]
MDPDTLNPFAGDFLSEYLPYEAYDDEHGIFINQTSLGFVIEAAPLVGGEDSSQKEILSLFQEVLEEGASLQCLLWADPRVDPFLDRWQEARHKTGPTYHTFAQKRATHFRQSPQIAPRVFRFILSYSVPSKSKQPTAQIKALAEIRTKILKTLGGLTYARPWGASDLLTHVNGLLHTTDDPTLKAVGPDPFQSLSSQLSTGGSLNVSDEGLSQDDPSETHLKTYRVGEFPDSWSMAEMGHLLGDITRESYRLRSPFFIHYGVHMPKQIQAEGRFKRKSQLSENQGKSLKLRRLIPDLDEELQENDYVRKSLRKGGKFVRTQLSVGLWAPVAKLKQEEQTLKSLFRIHNFSLIDNRYRHLAVFRSCLPMTWAEYTADLQDVFLLKTTLTSEAGLFVPLQGEWSGTPNPGMLLLGRRGQLLNWNPFDNHGGNFNTVVLGTSGSGKSVFMQDLLLSGLGTGAKVFVLEVGRSFEKLCDSLEGQHITFSSQSRLCLNPFSRISTIDQEERLSSFALIKSVIGCMAAPQQGTSDYENALIERAINHAWQLKGPKATITDVAHYLEDQQDPRAKSLAVMLTPYCKGGLYAKYFEGENNLDFSKPMVVVELEELKEQKDLQTVILQLCMLVIANTTFMGDRKTPFYICIDEAWDLLRSPQTVPFIETFARRLRKYNGALITGTQNAADFFSKPGAMAAFTNSDWICLLAQKQESMPILSEQLNLSSSKRHALETIHVGETRFKEVMICDSDGNYSIAQLHLDPFSKLLYSTNAADYSRIKELQRQGHSITGAIETLLERTP